MEVMKELGELEVGVRLKGKKGGVIEAGDETTIPTPPYWLTCFNIRENP